MSLYNYRGLVSQLVLYLPTTVSLSRPATLINSYPSAEVGDEDTFLDHLVSRLHCLLVPRQPGIFRSTTSAHVLTRFTEVLNSFAANAGATGGVGGGAGASDKSRVALASVMGLCRLSPVGPRYVHALGMDSSDIAAQFSAFLIGELRKKNRWMNNHGTRWTGRYYTKRLPSFFSHISSLSSARSDATAPSIHG